MSCQSAHACRSWRERRNRWSASGDSLAQHVDKHVEVACTDCGVDQSVEAHNVGPVDVAPQHKQRLVQDPRVAEGLQQDLYVHMFVCLRVCGCFLAFLARQFVVGLRVARALSNECQPVPALMYASVHSWMKTHLHMHVDSGRGGLCGVFQDDLS
jgi:hypothetical protein